MSWRSRGEKSGRWSAALQKGLAQEVLEVHARIRLGVAVLHNDGGLQGESPFCAGGMRDGTRAGNHDGFFGNNQRLGLGGCVDLVANEIVNRNGAIEYRAGAKNGAALHDGPFIHAGISTNQYFVFDDDWQRSNGFE